MITVASAKKAVPYRNRLRKENLAGFLFLTPSLIGFIGFILFPMVFSLFLSFTKWSFISGFKDIHIIGFQNFTMLFKDYKFIAALKNTVYYIILTVPISIIFGFLIAVLIHDFVYGKTAMKIAIFLPYISSLVAISIVWKVILHPTMGPVNQILMALGVADPPKWFGDTHWALIGIAIETIWLQLGYNVILFMAGFTGINTDLYEAAKIDGCGSLRKVFYVTIPSVAPTTFFLTIMALINSFKVFDQVSVITQGGPGDSTIVMAYYIYQEAFQFYDMGYASALSWIMFAIIMAITLIQWKFGDKSNY